MDIVDKRLIVQMDSAEMQKYLHELKNSIPDADGKSEECQITHEPVNLLGKLERKRSSSKEEATADITANQASGEESSESS